MIEGSTYRHEACDVDILSNWPIGTRGLCTYIGFPRLRGCTIDRNTVGIDKSVYAQTLSHVVALLVPGSLTCANRFGAWLRN